MVNQTNQNITHICKWAGCNDKFDSMLSLWKHVEQQHVDNAEPRLIHLVNDDDDIPVTTTKNTPMTNQSHNVYPAQFNNTNVINAIMSGTGSINNVQNINLMNNLQGVQQQGYHMLRPNIPFDALVNTTQVIQQTTTATAYLSQKPPLYNYQMGTQPTLLQQQQQQIIQSTSQASMVPLGSMPNRPITIDDNTMDVDSHININHQRLQNKGANLNRQSLSQNTKK